MLGDDELLAVVAASYHRHDPVPAEVIAAAEAAGALRPAAIDWDWLEHLGEPAGVRGPGPQLLTFGGGGVDLDVELYRERGTAGLRGLLSPAEPARVEVCWPAGGLTASTDAHGRFDAVGLPAGPLRLVVHRAGHRTGATRWFVS